MKDRTQRTEDDINYVRKSDPNCLA